MVLCSSQHEGRGVISMANSGADTNGSQFFITYSKQMHLNNKYTVFARCACRRPARADSLASRGIRFDGIFRKPGSTSTHVRLRACAHGSVCGVRTALHS
jgi:hypothetical protein